MFDRSRLMRAALAVTAAALLALPRHAGAQPAAVTGEQRPVLEFGLGAGGAWRPDYPASDQNRFTGLALPFLILRTDVLRSDATGTRGRLLRADWGEFNISASGTFPSSSSGNNAREGMPDLGWLGEIGPAVRLNLWTDPERTRRIIMELPVRGAFSATTDPLAVRYRGLIFNPEIAWEQRNVVFPNARLRLGLGPIFGTDRFASYYYEVQPEFARPNRPAYDARAGYIGTRLQGSFRVPVTERLSVAVGGRVDGFWGATNAGSPLFRSDLNVTLVAGVTWSLYQSTARVSASAEPFD